ncbi:MAG: hypothetical protein ACJ0NO_03215 [Flavobacteriaceae bacterium]|nr:hypothetical protein [Flavobacteriaceae bacterium]|tara:strand:+ start:45981 stop:46193 length:213 start_codon:yes stop_codon:yes gene_type:complete
MYKYISVFLIFLILSADIAFAQCSMCRAVLNSSEAQETAKGINNGILFLMSIPYLLLVFVGWKVYSIFKK